MAYEKIKTRVEGAIAIVTLNDPGTLNAAGVDLVQELQHAFDTFALPDSGVRCLILTGEGRGFCSGANLSGRGGEPVAPPPGGPDSGAALETIYNPFVTTMKTYPVPIVTAVNGVAAGVGCSLALLGDIIVCAESAYFLQAFRRIGLVPDGGSTYLLPRHIGRVRAMEMALLGEKLPSKTALEWGLVNRVVADDQVMSVAMEFANALASGPRSLGWTRQLIWDSLDASWTEQLHAERIMQRNAGRTEDSREGVMAFLEKRPTAFKYR